MNLTRISKSVQEALNKQITLEAKSSQIYLSFSNWAERQGLSGISHFLANHSIEEREHMMKINKYINKREGEAIIEAIPAPPADPKNIKDCFERIFKNEVANTKAIHKIVNLTHKEKDWGTFNFLQWFVQEQVEEETMAIELLEKLSVAGGSKISDAALMMLDNQVKEMA